MHSSTEPWRPQGKAPASTSRILHLNSLLESFNTDHGRKSKNRIPMFHAFITTHSQKALHHHCNEATAECAASLPAQPTSPSSALLMKSLCPRAASLPSFTLATEPTEISPCAFPEGTVGCPSTTLQEHPCAHPQPLVYRWKGYPSPTASTASRASNWSNSAMTLRTCIVQIWYHVSML